MRLSSKVVGGYWPYWNGPRLSAIDARLNTIYLFSARPVGGQPGTTGAVFFEQSRQTAATFKSDLAALRSTRTVILSVGGAGEYLRLDTRTRTTAFVASVKSIYTTLGGFDGLDWNIESDMVYPQEMVWASQQLRAAYGPDFAITFPPAPWRSTDRQVAAALVSAGVLDYVAPQYYDLTGLSDEAAQRNHAISNLSTVWLPIVGNDASKAGLGFKNTGTDSETMTVDSCVVVWKALVQKYPTLRGAFVWEITADAAAGYAFADKMSTAIGTSTPTPEPIPEPTPTPPADPLLLAPGATLPQVITAHNALVSSLRSVGAL